jgi:DNA recombination protein RmuC
MLATPTSLVALLKAVALRLEAVDAGGQCRRDTPAGRGVYKRLAVFGEHLGKLGKSLAAASTPSTRPWARWSQQVLPAARRFPDSGCG